MLIETNELNCIPEIAIQFKFELNDIIWKKLQFHSISTLTKKIDII